MLKFYIFLSLFDSNSSYLPHFRVTLLVVFCNVINLLSSSVTRIILSKKVCCITIQSHIFCCECIFRYHIQIYIYTYILLELHLMRPHFYERGYGHVWCEMSAKCVQAVASKYSRFFRCELLKLDVSSLSSKYTNLLTLNDVSRLSWSFNPYGGIQYRENLLSISENLYYFGISGTSKLPFKFNL